MIDTLLSLSLLLSASALLSVSVLLLLLMLTMADECPAWGQCYKTFSVRDLRIFVIS
jgi:hypothetical protein